RRPAVPGPVRLGPAFLPGRDGHGRLVERLLAPYSSVTHGNSAPCRWTPKFRTPSSTSGLATEWPGHTRSRWSSPCKRPATLLRPTLSQTDSSPRFAFRPSPCKANKKRRYWVGGESTMSAVLPLFPELEVEDPVPALIGIGRLAADAEPLDQRNSVQYAELEARSILSRCNSKRLPFEWTLNPYRGCEYGCQHCYARYTHEFMELRGGYDFERMIFVKRAAADLLRRELRRV